MTEMLWVGGIGLGLGLGFWVWASVLGNGHTGPTPEEEARARMTAIEAQLTAIHADLRAALSERVDLQAFIRQRVAARVSEFRAGNGRELLRNRLRARAQRRAAQQPQG